MMELEGIKSTKKKQTSEENEPIKTEKKMIYFHIVLLRSLNVSFILKIVFFHLFAVNFHTINLISFYFIKKLRKIQTYSFKDQRRSNTSNSEVRRMAWELPALNFGPLVIMDPLNDDDD